MAYDSVINNIKIYLGEGKSRPPAKEKWAVKQIELSTRLRQGYESYK
jgi:hypothetical protein